MEPDAVEMRVLGCLIEKQRTTPDAYPLSLNGLRLACNQSTNRNPVVAYDESLIKDALQRTYRRGWTRLTSGHGSRAAKYRHLLDEALELAPAELALLGVLMLRGAQTPGELKQRSERLHGFDDLAAVHATLTRLIERGHVAELPRQPGQKEERYVQLLGGAEDDATAPPDASGSGQAGLRAGPVAGEARSRERSPGNDFPAPPARSAAPAGTYPPVAAPSMPAVGEDSAVPGESGSADSALAARLAELERALAELRAEVAALRTEHGA